MLNVFKPVNIRACKTGYLLNDTTNQKRPFKYRYMTDEEVEELQFLEGLDSGRTSMAIATQDGLLFDSKSKLLINGFQWTVERLQGKLTDNKNGLYRNVQSKTTYLFIETGALYDKASAYIPH